MTIITVFPPTPTMLHIYKRHGWNTNKTNISTIPHRKILPPYSGHPRRGLHPQPYATHHIRNTKK